VIGFILHAIEKVRSGHGLDYYFTGLGVKFNYIGALALLVCIRVALLFGWLLNYWLSRDERGFKERFGRRASKKTE
jgi:ClpX C4-type zinc finger